MDKLKRDCGARPSREEVAHMIKSEIDYLQSRLKENAFIQPPKQHKEKK